MWRSDYFNRPLRGDCSHPIAFLILLVARCERPRPSPPQAAERPQRCSLDNRICRALDRLNCAPCACPWEYANTLQKRCHVGIGDEKQPCVCAVKQLDAPFGDFPVQACSSQRSLNRVSALRSAVRITLEVFLVSSRGFQSGRRRPPMRPHNRS